MVDVMILKNYLFSVKQYYSNYSICHELLKFKNVHEGKRCFIIGTGPSLTPSDLNKLEGEITFASNRIFEIYPKTHWRPIYYVNQDFKLIEKYAEEIKKLSVKRKFLPIEAKKFFTNQDDISYFVLRHKDYYPRYADFSTHIDRYVCQGFTVTYGAIQLAYYMGFSNVYLLGIDHNYSISLNEKGVPVMQENVRDYFEGAGASNVGLNLPRVVESTMAYMTAKRFADRHPSFNVFNATRGGKLDAFERVDLDKVLSEAR